MDKDWQHIEIQDHGSVPILRPFSDEAITWFAENVGEPEAGGTYTCEPRLGGEIVRAAALALLTQH